MSTRAWPGLVFLALHLSLGSLAHAGEPPAGSEPVAADAPPLALPPAAPTASAYPPAAYQPPVRLPALVLPPREPLPPPGNRRGTGIALIVVGNVIQFIGVSTLFPAVWHSVFDSNTRFPVVSFGAIGGSLVGVGNILEIYGWVLYGRGEVDRRRAAHAAADCTPPQDD